ncbi:hypothetical protein BGZ65_004277 [Modicella reniformis]|uniref:GST N-terminal domain-containing protein n=1 Tax=Modicella reniformis TaxID=1440133 RepID=A0A9P6MHC8_9FUNG|nr:hypothetical protein BGZ65_004277 [Modicella reniformis]
MTAPKLFDLVDGKTRKVSFSPMVWRAKFALNHKKVAYETIPVTFLDIPVLIPKTCPNITSPTVPTMQISGNEGIQDSLAIAEYLEKTYPDGPSIFGREKSEKNLQKFFDSYVSSKLHPVIQRLVYIEMYEAQDDDNAAYFKSSREKSGGNTLENLGGDPNQNIKELKEHLGLIHKALGSGEFITGEQPGWADFTLLAAFIWFNSFSPQKFEEGVLNAFGDQVLRNYWQKAQALIH